MAKKKIRCDECGQLIKADGKTAAERVIEAFGGASRLADLTGIDRTSVYRWTYSREKGGTAGAIPHGNHGKLLAVAARNKIKLLKSDLV